MSEADSAVKIRMVKYLNGGQPYTAFVALDDDDYADVVAAGTGDLSAYARQILSVIPTHDVGEKDVEVARFVFAKMYGSAFRPPRRDLEAPEAAD